MDYNIILPSKPRVISEDETKGVYEIDGLYAGYGHTLGNSLRRIILSSMPGSAVTSVKIEGINHEFSVIPGIKEDVITILLNLKKIRFKSHGNEEYSAAISVKGAKNITAKDIKLPAQLEILNEDAHIATLTGKDSKFNAELTIEKGLGYVPKESLHKDKVDVGTIILDAIFTPVRRVNYEVENMRVGEQTNYNRLRISIETDGIITPKEALEKSIEIMISHLKSIIGFQEEEKLIEEIKEIAQEKAAEDAENNENENENAEFLKTRIEDLYLSSRTIKILSEAGIRTVGGLVRKKEEDLMELEGVGKKAVQEIRRSLGEFGLTLK